MAMPARFLSPFRTRQKRPHARQSWLWRKHSNLSDLAQPYGEDYCQYMDSAYSTDLGSQFDAAFLSPFTRYAWQSRRARSCWMELQGYQDALAGPIYSVLKSGNCAYIYALENAYFSGVRDPDTLHARLRYWHSKLIAGLDDFVPRDEAEQVDLAAMREFARKTWFVAEKAIDIERSTVI